MKLSLGKMNPRIVDRDISSWSVDWAHPNMAAVIGATVDNYKEIVSSRISESLNPPIEANLRGLNVEVWPVVLIV